MSDLDDLNALQNTRNEVEDLKIILDVPGSSQALMKELLAYREALKQIEEHPELALLIAINILRDYPRR